MSDMEQTDQVTSRIEGQVSQRKLYVKPDVRHEHVFETLALSCGKVQGTQGACRSVRKSS